MYVAASKNMKRVQSFAFLFVVLISASSAHAANGPQTSSIVLTLPNPEITPNWQSFAPPECASNPAACALDHRFWELWDLNNFADAIDASFSKIAAQGNYSGFIPILPLGDTPTFQANIALLAQYAAKYGLAFDPSIFPKWKFGAEWCYLYSDSAPAGCPAQDGTSVAVAYVKLVALMGFIQSLGDSCADGSYNRRVAVWYGWRDASPGFQVLDNFWHSLPNSPCNHQSAYTIWLDEPFAGVPEIKAFQDHSITDHEGEQWVITELYGARPLDDYAHLYDPYQIVDTGFSGAPSAVEWANRMCVRWRDTLSQPDKLIVWTYFDRDVAPFEHYGALIGQSLADITSICQ